MNLPLFTPLAALLLLAVPAFAQVGFTGSGYSENFNGLGTGNTAPPAGWAFYGNLAARIPPGRMPLWGGFSPAAPGP